MVRFLFYMCFLVCCLSVQADSKRRAKVMRAKSKVDSLLDAHVRVRVDTSYITRPATYWTLKVRTRGYGNNVSVSGDADGIGKFRSQINTPLKTTIGFSANYRGLSLSLAVNPARLFALNSSRNINMSLYNNRYGADLQYSSTDNLTTNAIIGDNEWDMKLTDSYLRQFSASAYYVLNGRRFSYPAAFTHSWLQRRSAGSFIVSAGLYMGSFKSSFDDNTGYLSLDKSIRMRHISVGAGYAYNHVTNRRWLLHFSLVPHLIVWHNYRYSLSVDPNTNLPLRKKIPYNFPGVQGTGRFGVTYNWSNYFAGMTSMVQSSHVGIANEAMRAGNTSWRVELFLGMRL